MKVVVKVGFGVGRYWRGSGIEFFLTFLAIIRRESTYPNAHHNMRVQEDQIILYNRFISFHLP